MDNGDMTGHDWSRRGKKYNFQFSPPYLNNGPLDQDPEVQLLSFTCLARLHIHSATIIDPRHFPGGRRRNPRFIISGKSN